MQQRAITNSNNDLHNLNQKPSYYYWYGGFLWTD